MSVREMGGVRVFVCADEGPGLAEDPALSDLVGELFSSDAAVAAIPLARLGPDFLRLGTGVAGAVLQKLVNYRFQVAVVGDVTQPAAASLPLRDFVRESNRGRIVWFVPDLVDLEQRLVADRRS